MNSTDERFRKQYADHMMRYRRPPPCFVATRDELQRLMEESHINVPVSSIHVKIMGVPVVIAEEVEQTIERLKAANDFYIARLAVRAETMERQANIREALENENAGLAAERDKLSTEYEVTRAALAIARERIKQLETREQDTHDGSEREGCNSR